jgi:hypothetical protein
VIFQCHDFPRQMYCTGQCTLACDVQGSRGLEPRNMMKMVVVLLPSIELLAQSLRCERLSAGSLKIPLLNGGAMPIGFISFLLPLNKSNYKAYLHKFQRIKNIITPPNLHSDKNLSLFSTLKCLHFIHHLLE